jgi:hypothetical protein
LLSPYEVYEALVDSAVLGEFGMEGGGHDVSLFDEDGEAVAFGEDLDTVAGFHDAWRADVDHFERAARELRFAGLDGGVDLAAVGIALDGDVEDAEAFLVGVGDFGGEEDASGAGAEGGFGPDKGAEGVEEAAAFEKFEEGGGFAAGNDETVDVGELFGLADEDGLGSGFAERLSVGIVVALEGEYANAGRIEAAGRLIHD